MVGFFVSIGLLIPTLPLYVRDLGGSPVDVGLVVGVFSFGVLVVRPVVGRLLDTRGRRVVLILGSALAAVMAPLYLWLTAVALLVAVRVVHGVGLSAFTGGWVTMVTDLSPPERRTEFMGYLSAATTLAFAVGAPVGIEIASRAGYPALFLTVSGTAVVSAALAAALREPERSSTAAQPEHYRAAISRRQVVVPAATLLLATLTVGAVFAFLPILLEQRRPGDFSLFFIVHAVTSVIVRIMIARVAQTIGDRRMVWGGLVIHALGIASLPLIQGRGSMLGAAVLFGMGFAILWPALYGLVANDASEIARGMVLSFLLAAFDLGMGLGGLVSGPIVARAGIPALMNGMAVVPIVALTFFLIGLGWRSEATAPQRVVVRS
ncbi:MAG: MFS transporter [Gemmatimonadota bacterium]